MPQPRKYKTNAERQAAYRARKAASETRSATPGAQSLVKRLVAQDAAVRAREA